MASEKSRVLVIGGTGYIGHFIVAASAREGHPTAVLVRDATPADAAKAAVLQGFRDAGVTLVKVFIMFLVQFYSIFCSGFVRLVALQDGVMLVRNDNRSTK
jgi:nucleoside-diphosphate-sugar epimerase